MPPSAARALRYEESAGPAVCRSWAREPLRDSLSDGQLVTLALNGDRRAFPKLVARHDRQLKRVIARRAANTEDAEDLAQDAWTAAWSHLQSYPAASPFETWLVCIALNKCRDLGRRQTVRRRAAPHLTELAPDAVPDPERQACDRDEVRRLRRSLEDLPATLSAPLLLTAAHDLRQREAADLLGLSVKSVETRISRARARLRDGLATALA